LSHVSYPLLYTAEMQALEAQLSTAKAQYEEVENEKKALLCAMREKEKEKAKDKRAPIMYSKAIQADEFSMQAEVDRLNSLLAIAEGP
jgi:hypothetical protein